jgi:hypothetical protein
MSERVVVESSIEEELFLQEAMRARACSAASRAAGRRGHSRGEECRDVEEQGEEAVLRRDGGGSPGLGLVGQSGARR